MLLLTQLQTVLTYYLKIAPSYRILVLLASLQSLQIFFVISAVDFVLKFISYEVCIIIFLLCNAIRMDIGETDAYLCIGVKSSVLLGSDSYFICSIPLVYSKSKNVNNVVYALSESVLRKLFG